MWLAAAAFICYGGTTIFSPAVGAVKEIPVNQEKSDIDRLASYAPPKGWKLEKSSAADPSVVIKNLRHVIRIRLFGGKNSRYGEPSDFLDGFQARTMGRPPRKGRVVKVSGIRTRIFNRRYPINLGDPHEAGTGDPDMADEEFCFVPVGGRFFVLSYALESPMPDLDDLEGAAWKSFLKSFKLLGKKKRK